MGLFNAFAGNLQQVSNDQLMQQYGPFLFSGEQITNGYQLIRDAVVFTNMRIIQRFTFRKHFHIMPVIILAADSIG